jgi:hypothetical protein
VAVYDLIQHAKTTRDPLLAGALNTLLQRSNFITELDWDTIGTLSQRVTRWKSLPALSYRPINGAFSGDIGRFEQLEETVASLGIDIDVDVMYDRDQAATQDPRGTQAEMAVTSMAFTFNDSFINGDLASDPNGIDGLKKRVANLPAAQTITAAANGLDVNVSDANRHTFLDLLGQARYLLEGGADLIIGNGTTYQAFESVVRRLGLYATDTDRYGRRVNTFGEGGPVIVDAGTKYDLTTPIITQTETQGSASDCTSIYIVRLGMGTYLHGIQEYPVRTKDLGEREAAPVMRTRIDWTPGLAQWNDRAIIRIKGIRWV